MMSSLRCESCCATPLCYFPCLAKSKDDAGGDSKFKSLSHVAVVDDKPPVVQKIEEYGVAAETATSGIVGVSDDEKCNREVVVAPKSCWKRANCEDSSMIVAKGNAKWGDLLEKDLTQVKEFEPKYLSCSCHAHAIDGVSDDDKCDREVAVAPKSCLKRANYEYNNKIVAKGNVKWRDLLGKDLTQIKEFESWYLPCSCHVCPHYY